MKFQWYLIDCVAQTVKGTNDVEVVQTFLDNPDYILLTAQHGKYFNGSKNEIEVEEFDSDVDDTDDDYEDDDSDEDDDV
jgi:hypothetical protein